MRSTSFERPILARRLKPGVAEMPSNEPKRPGPTPVIRLDGDTITYFLWIDRRTHPGEVLVLRCDGTGNVFASIRNDIEVCNRHGRL